MRIYIYELIIAILNIICGIYQFRLNRKILGAFNLGLAGIIIVLIVIMAVQDIKAYFYNKEIRKRYENKEQINDSKDL